MEKTFDQKEDEFMEQLRKLLFHCQAEGINKFEILYLMHKNIFSGLLTENLTDDEIRCVFQYFLERHFEIIDKWREALGEFREDESHSAVKDILERIMQ